MYKIFGKANCAGCDQAKNLLKLKNIDFQYVDITTDKDAMMMFRNKGFRAVPQIFQGDKHIGGFQELQVLV